MENVALEQLRFMQSDVFVQFAKLWLLSILGFLGDLPLSAFPAKMATTAQKRGLVRSQVINLG